MIPLRAKVWGFWILAIVGMTFLSSLAHSTTPGFAFAVARAPNGLFLVAFAGGALHLPSSLEPVHPIEPLLYHWVGVGLVKLVTLSVAFTASNCV